MAIDGLEISREDIWPKPSRWNAEKRYQIVKEALSQKEPLAKTAMHVGLTIPPNALARAGQRDQMNREHDRRPCD